MNDFDVDAIRRHEMVLATHPIHSKRDLPPRPTTRLIPAYERIAMLEAQKACYVEARDDYQDGINICDSELKILRDEQ